MISRVLILSFIVFISSTANAVVMQNYFISKSFGAGITALGEATTAICGDPENIYINPASNGFSEHYQIETTFAQHYNASYAQGSISGVLPLGNAGVFAAALPIKLVSDIPLTADQGGEFVKTGAFSNMGVGGYMSYSRAITNSFSAGVSVKLIREKLYNSYASGVGYDLGVLYRLNADFARFSFAVSVLDLGNTGVIWDTPSRHFDYLPMTTRIGAALESDLFAGTLKMAADLASSEVGSSTAVGVQFSIGGIALMGGLNDRNGRSNVSCGMGLDLGMARLNYSLQSDEELGNTAKFTTGFSF